MARPCESRRRVGVWVVRSAGDGKSVAIGEFLSLAGLEWRGYERCVRDGIFRGVKNRPAASIVRVTGRLPNGRAAMPEPEISSKFCSPERV